MSTVSGPKIPNRRDTVLFFDASNPKSYNRNTKTLKDLYGSTTINANNVQLSNGYLSSDYKTLIGSNQQIENSTIITQITNSTSTKGVIYSIASSTQQIYSAFPGSTYESFDYPITAFISSNLVYSYSSTNTANYNSIQFDISSLGSANGSYRYNSSNIVSYDSNNFGISASGNSNNTILYSGISNTNYEYISQDLIYNEVSSFIDNADQKLELSLSGTSLKLKFKKNNSEINMNETYIPTAKDLITVVISKSSNTFNVGLYQNSSLLKSASVNSYGNTLPYGSTYLFSNGNYANHTNASIRLFGVVNKTLTDSEIQNLNDAIGQK